MKHSKPTDPPLQSPESILQSVWGYSTFRGTQKEIINTVLKGKHTFVSMPTGGGKSLCYQIPVLCSEGIGIVISPLVALMKDQINNLKKVGVKAIDISSGLSHTEITQRIDNCIHGNYQFLYLSPERLSSERIQLMLTNLNVAVLIIDEAHCISQWGHDFRPAYLKVDRLIKLFPNTPVISLTASATQQVKSDIIKTLNLPNIVSFEDSFERSNIAYSQFNVADKLHYVQKILTKNTGSSIVYVRTRKGAIDWSNHLNQLGYKSTYYHGRLSTKDKEQNMLDWTHEQVQVMVATNAFGMGIDKANVQSVIHIDLPENIENYYQESGRAGRNGKPAHAVILYNNSDIERIERQTLDNLSDRTFLLHFYKKMCSTLQIAYGEGLDITYSLPLEIFCTKNKIPITKAYNCLQFLDRQNCIILNPNFANRTSVQLLIGSKDVIQYLDNNTSLSGKILLQIIRNHPGIYETAITINSNQIAQINNCTQKQLHQALQQLTEQNIINYQPETTNIEFQMIEIREDEYTINRIAKNLKQYNQLKKEQLQALKHFIEDKNTCINIKILAYFGEIKNKKCGICSNCIQRSNEHQPTIQRIKILLQESNLNSKDMALLLQEDEKIIITALQNLLESNTIAINDANNYYLQ